MAHAAPTGDLTLHQFLHDWVIPNCLVFSRPRNIAQYVETIHLWEEATRSPKLKEVTQQHVSEFLKALRTRQTKEGNLIADSTIRKHCVALQFVLDRAGPPTHSVQDGQGILDRIPFIKKPKILSVVEVQDAFTLPEIVQWLEACAIADRKPIRKSMPHSTWWRASILVGYITGMRLKALLTFRKDWIEQDEFGTWVHVPASASKTKVPYRCFINSVGLDAIQRVLRGSQRQEIFKLSIPTTTLHEMRRWIMAECNFPVERRFGWHGLRKACASELAPISEMASSMQLGHAKGGMTRDHYVTRKKLLAQSVKAMPMPDWQWPHA